MPRWLSDSENESDNEEIPDLGKDMFIEPDIVEASDDSGVGRNGVNVIEEVESFEISRMHSGSREMVAKC